MSGDGTVVRWRAAVRAASWKRRAYEVLLILVAVATTTAGILLMDTPQKLAAIPHLKVALAVVAALATAVVVPLRLVWPVGAFLAVVAIGALAGGSDVLLLVFLSVGMGYRTKGYIRPALALLATVAILPVFVWWHGVSSIDAAITAAACYVPGALVPAIAGRLVAQRRSLITAMNDRNVQLHREQTATGQRARARERTRIARDLHDSLGHQLTLISLYAGALPSVPESQRAETLSLLRSTSAEAMTELRQILGVLGQNEDADNVGTARPLSSMPDVVEAARSAGAHVSLTQVGTPRPLPMLVDHAGYRMVQEGLTNALRHAGGAPIDVNVRYESDTLVVEVINGPGTPHSGPTSGQGLLGLAERVRLAGGVLYHGPAPGGGFRLAAMLPYTSGEPASPDTLPAPLGDFSQHIRTSRRRTAYGLVAIGVSIVAVGILCTVAVLRYPMPGTVDPETYGAVQEGAPEAEVRRVLPGPDEGITDGIGGGPIPEDATCVDYPAAMKEQLLNDDANTNVVYRFCFRDGKLLTKTNYLNRNIRS